MFVQLHHYSLHSCEKGARVINHRSEVDCTIMPHWPTVNEVIPFITARSGTAGCSLVLASRHNSPLLSAAVRGRSHVVHLNAAVTQTGPTAAAPILPATCPSSCPRTLSVKVCSVAFEDKTRRRGAANSIDQNNIYNRGDQ